MIRPARSRGDGAYSRGDRRLPWQHQHQWQRRQCRGRCTGISGSSPGQSVRSSSSRPGPKMVAVPVYPDAQLSRACGECGLGKVTTPSPQFARVDAAASDQTVHSSPGADFDHHHGAGLRGMMTNHWGGMVYHSRRVRLRAHQLAATPLRCLGAGGPTVFCWRCLAHASPIRDPRHGHGV